jgi:hypothetical protein
VLLGPLLLNLEQVSQSLEEFDSLGRKAEESEKLSEMKVAAAMAQVEAIRASENEAIKKLEAARKEMEDMEVATEEALKRSEMAESAKKAVEGEVKRWREKEQKKTAEAPPSLEAHAQDHATESPMQKASGGKAAEKNEGHQRNSRMLLKKSFMMPNITSMFHKKSHADNSSLSYLPGGKSV